MLLTTSPQSHAPRVFIVDDHDDSREMMKEFFDSNGFSVACCADGCQAVQEALRLEPDVIILDGRLPGKDGWDVTRELRSARGAVAKTPIVFVSAAADAHSKMKATSSGCTCYLTKPLDLGRLIETVIKLVAPRHLDTQTTF
jgi:two-component system, cell cycle response regulator DivK